MGNDGFVTQEECEDRQNKIYKKLEKHEEDIGDMKILIAEIKTSFSIVATIGKATFGVVASGLVTIIVILLTRGI